MYGDTTYDLHVHTDGLICTQVYIHVSICILCTYTDIVCLSYICICTDIYSM